MSSKCFHCGLSCEDDAMVFDEKEFCCNGCVAVYEIINHSSLENFYKLNSQAGFKPQDTDVQYKYLDDPAIFDSVISFSDGGTSIVEFHVPVIHCSSCIWLLESLQKINPKILQSIVDFSAKTVQISFKTEEIKLSELAVFLTNLGYKPSISLETLSKEGNKKRDNGLILRLVVAGFCFGNIMLFTIPEYLEANDWNFQSFSLFFKYLIFLLSLPLLFFCAQPYFSSAWQGLKNKHINIDIPIAIGVLILFIRSSYEMYYQLSLGYFDSLGGLIFFMLIGKYFQERTYKSLSFDRSYKSFYPIAITKLENGKEVSTTLDKILVGDRLLIRNMEIIPTDAILIKGNATIDNSFITGESTVLHKKTGDKLFAGGKQNGQSIEVESIKKVNQSYLTKLWEQTSYNEEQKSSLNNLTTQISKYFSISILVIALISAIAWCFIDPDKVFLVTTAILIVACPCALGLSAPFTLGNSMRVLSRLGFYVKNTNTIERMAGLNFLVFDKTGTLTDNNNMLVEYEGRKLSDREKSYIKSIVKNSNHPLSRRLAKELPNTPTVDVHSFSEIAGGGLEAKVDGKTVKIGSAKFVGLENSGAIETEINISIDNVLLGVFYVKSALRKEILHYNNSFRGYKTAVLSGDNKKDLEIMKKALPFAADYCFNQSPTDKLSYIKKLQSQSQKVMMLGDGLNDSGALKQSDVGVAIVDDINGFSPASDVILDAKRLDLLPKILKFSKQSMTLVRVAFFISLCYNVVGLFYAITGRLEPVVAAILMPASSITIVLFATFGTWAYGSYLSKKTA